MPPIRLASALALLVLAPLAACDGGSGAAAPDGAPAAPDAELSGELAGRWRKVSFDGQPGDDQTLELGADGGFVLDDATGDHVEGVFTIEGDRMLVDSQDPGGATLAYDFTYHLAGDLLGVTVALPDGPRAGVVGSYRGHLRVAVTSGGATEVNGEDQRYTLAADGSATQVRTFYDDRPAETTRGAWTLDGELLTFSYVEGGGSYDVTMRVLDGTLAGVVFARDR